MLYSLKFTIVDSIPWPDPIFAQERCHLQYKRPAQKGAYTAGDNAPCAKIGSGHARLVEIYGG